MGKLGDMDIGPSGEGSKHYRPAKGKMCEWHGCQDMAQFRETLPGPFLNAEIDVCPIHGIEVRRGRFSGEIPAPRWTSGIYANTAQVPPPAPVRNALEQANDLIYGDRAKAYGPADENHTAIAKMMDNWLQLRYPSGEYHDLDAYDSCMFNLMQKISRLAHSLRQDPMNPHRDSLVDGAGYFGVMAKIDDERRAKAAKSAEWAAKAPDLIKAAMSFEKVQRAIEDPT